MADMYEATCQIIRRVLEIAHFTTCLILFHVYYFCIVYEDTLSK